MVRMPLSMLVSVVVLIMCSFVVTRTGLPLHRRCAPATAAPVEKGDHRGVMERDDEWLGEGLASLRRWDRRHLSRLARYWPSGGATWDVTTTPATGRLCGTIVSPPASPRHTAPPDGKSTRTVCVPSFTAEMLARHLARSRLMTPST